MPVTLGSTLQSLRYPNERCRMRKSIAVLICVVASVLAIAVVQAVAQHPSWAYGFIDPPPAPGAAAPAAPAGGGGAAAPAAAPDTTALTVPGSDRKYTRT